MKQLRLANKLIAALVRDRLYYPGRLFVDTLSLIARFFVLFFLYKYAFSLNGGIVRGTTFDVVAWSMFFYFAFSVFRLRDIAQAIMDDVRSGNVETLFCKPISYIAYRMLWQIGSGLHSFLFLGVAGSVVLAMTVGIPETFLFLAFVPTFFLTMLFGIVLSLCLYLLVGLLAFWIEDVKPVFWIVDKTVMILGGSYLPVALFPPAMYAIAVYSPFGATQFLSHTAYFSWQTEWVWKAGLQAMWIVVLGVSVWVMFRQARRKVFVNGG